MHGKLAWCPLPLARLNSTQLPILTARCELNGITAKMTFPSQDDLANFSRRRLLEVLKWCTEQDVKPMFLQHEDTGETIGLEEFTGRLEAVWKGATSAAAESDAAVGEGGEDGATAAA